MTTKNFNAKKVLMSTVAAVVFSFVFTTNANAQSVENRQKDNLEVRVKTTSNEKKQKNNLGIRVKTTSNENKQKNNLGIRVKTSSNKNNQKDNLGIRVKTTSNENKQNGLEEFTDFIGHMFQTVFGVRV